MKVPNASAMNTGRVRKPNPGSGGKPLPSSSSKFLKTAGTQKADTLNGKSNNNRIDLIAGRGGNDKISGGAGTNIIFAGAGNDQIWAGRGQDVIDGGSGKDTVRIKGRRGNYRAMTRGNETVLIGTNGSAKGKTISLRNVEQVVFQGSKETVSIKELRKGARPDVSNTFRGFGK